jgi:hypothetical protein
VIVYNINLNSLKNIFNLNNKQNDLSKCLIKTYKIYFYDYLEHLIICCTKFFRAGAISNGPKYQSISGTREEKKIDKQRVPKQVFLSSLISVRAWGPGFKICLPEMIFESTLFVPI